MKQTSNITKHLELENYYYKGVGVTVEINYDAGTISLVDKNPQIHNGPDVPKKWIFAGRQVEYMPGWLNILDAMKYAIQEAEGKLLKHQAEQEKKLRQKEKDLYSAIADIRPDNDPFAPHKQPDKGAPYQNINRANKK